MPALVHLCSSSTSKMARFMAALALAYMFDSRYKCTAPSVPKNSDVLKVQNCCSVTPLLPFLLSDLSVQDDESVITISCLRKLQLVLVICEPVERLTSFQQEHVCTLAVFCMWNGHLWLSISSQLHLLCDSLVVPLLYHSKTQLGLFLFKGMLLVEYGIDLVLG